MDSRAKEFKEFGQMKEFVDDSGRHYYVIQFRDNSGLVFQKEKSKDGKSIAEFVPRNESTKQSIRQIDSGNNFDVREGNTHQMVRNLLKSD